MAHGDVVFNPNLVADGIKSPIVSLCDSSEYRGGIRVAAPVTHPTTTFFEFRNQSSKSVAFRLKCTHPSHFTVKPRSVGLVSPKDVQELRLTLLTNFDDRANYHLLMETTFIQFNQDPTQIGKQEIAQIWSDVKKNDITTTRFPIYASPMPEDKLPPKLYVFFDEPQETSMSAEVAAENQLNDSLVLTKSETKEESVGQLMRMMFELLGKEPLFSNCLVVMILLSHLFFLYFSCSMIFRTFM